MSLSWALLHISNMWVSGPRLIGPLRRHGLCPIRDRFRLINNPLKFSKKINNPLKKINNPCIRLPKKMLMSLLLHTYFFFKSNWIH